ncbi:hemerythrin domain-containing protein [Nakamurella sp. GG22]
MTFAIGTARPDTWEMVFAHNSFRRHLGALPDLIRNVPDGDVQRAGTVVEFLDELVKGLHHHHEAEDELMWPLLLERAPMDSVMILRMEEQHERIGELYQRAAGLAADFAAAADPVHRAELADTVADLVEVLGVHLQEEEAEILPLVERVMTVPEWEAVGERARGSMPKERQLVFLGFLLDANPPELNRAFLGRLPLPARAAWKVLGRRAFAKEYRRIYLADPAR